MVSGMSVGKAFVRTLGAGALLYLGGAPGALAASQACDGAVLPLPADCVRANAGLTVTMPVGANSERPVAGKLGPRGFTITEEAPPRAAGPRLDAGAGPASAERLSDLAAAAGGVDLRFDGLDPRRLLNVTTTDLRAGYAPGERVTFRASSNYPAWLTRGEVRLLRADGRSSAPVATLPVQPNGSVDWAMPADAPADMVYVLRVYDAEGRFDETRPRPLSRSADRFATHEVLAPAPAAGEGEDNTRARSIPVRGGRVTVAGNSGGSPVRVMGEPVPVDATGAFVVTRILPPGVHSVEVAMGPQVVRRSIEIPDHQSFGVGLIDLTAGWRVRDDLAKADPDFRRSYVDGRIAGYGKTTLASGVTITGSVDSGEGPIEDVLHRLNDKDPHRVIERLDPEDLYPTYGDDSTAYDDAPTSGRFYLRVAKDASTLTWGDFKSDIGGTAFLRQSRALYGAELRYVTPETTAIGDPRARVQLYAAQPDTLPQRDILRGTGGSVYFLSRQDIDGGSETLTIETVDPVTGRVLSRRTLAAGTDYEIDYMQGVVTLTSPLGSSATGGQVIGAGTGAYDVNLVAQYEYTPISGSLSGASTGGRIEAQATDRLRVGLTALNETTGPADQQMAGVDLHYNLGGASYLEAEIDGTRGPGFGRSLSTDGGLTITSSGPQAAGRARAYRFDSQIGLADLGLAPDGSVKLYAERKEAGFSTLNEDVAADQTLTGLTADVPLSARARFGADLETFRKAGGDKRDRGELRLRYALDDRWTVVGAVAGLDETTATDPTRTGSRTDAGLRLEYRQSADLMVYGFGQTTLAYSGGVGRNDRLGVGAEGRLGEKITAAGEVSGGAKGPGGLVRLTYAPSADSEVYAGYSLDPARDDRSQGYSGGLAQGLPATDNDGGRFTYGARTKMNDRLSVWTESGWDTAGDRRALTRSYGVSYTPAERWTLTGALEVGKVRDVTMGDFNRRGLSVGAAYADSDAERGKIRLEYRTESGQPSQDRRTWAATAAYDYRLSPNWRFVSGLDALYSRADQTSFRDGEYLEASLGFAYRPILDDRLNMLAKYTYLRDLPGADQVSIDGTRNGPLQVSHILSVDADYDLNPRLTFGAKYGYRRSELSQRGSGIFTPSTAHLGIARIDWHVVHLWDVMAEGRILYTEETGDKDTGAVLGIWRHLGNNAKVGLGYEWGRVSDDLAKINYHGQGLFLNVVGTF